MLCLADRLEPFGGAASEEAKGTALDHIHHGVVLVDAHGRVLFANRAAGAIMRLGDGIALMAEGLRARSVANAKQLKALISEAAKGGSGGTMRVVRASLAEPLLLLIVPALPQGCRPTDASPAAIVFVTDPTCAPTPTRRMLRELFGLTATEAKVAMSIAAGNDCRNTARQLRMSMNTVHTHMRHIFRKLGVHRQADLVRVLIRAGIALPAVDEGANTDRDARLGGISEADDACAGI
jgi:DNA-binding CsgD family transcriptional regulator